ncbi:MAG TPA: hypothetical protein VFF03_20000 [Rhodocyclaceae bacterium]|nr:hypothetical protein [Rhodocyclaceae bacterium]
MADLIAKLRNGLRLPPTGWVLAGMLTFYVIAGLVGRDPWKGEDAIHLGTAWNMLAHGDWLSPELAGRPFNEPPLYYWSAALTGKVLGWLLPLHDAMRVASGIWVALALVGIYYAGRELHGQESAAASPLLLAGTAGLILHAHDAQPFLVALAAYGGGLGAMAAFGRKPKLAAGLYGGALAACFLGTGIAPTLPLLVAGPLAAVLASDRRTAWRTCLAGLLFFILLAAPWPVALGLFEPGRLNGWLAAEFAQFFEGTPSPRAFGAYLGVLLWFAFPTLPIAAWWLWTSRNRLKERTIALPLTLFGLTLLLLVLAYRPKELPALLLLPPLALLATPGALSLRRGAANAFDWFSMMTFTFFAGLVWFGWSALALGWPEKLAKRTVVLRPGFVGHFEPLPVLIAALGTLAWAWLMLTSRRSPYRSLTHWTMGFTTFWLLATLLWLPWFDYGKSYRPVALAIAKQLPAGHGCLAERDLSDTHRASLAYFTGIEPQSLASSTGKRCNWLLVQGDSRRELAAPEGNWSLVWEGSRPGDKRERFRLYQR